ncbi:acyl carrier protein, mitochondrial [Diutina catenulata]
MFRSVAKTAFRVPMASRIMSPMVARPAMALRFYGAFPELTRDIAKERILELLEGYDKIGADKQVYEESSFVQDLGLDSLDVVEVMMEVEHEFNIQIPDDEADKLKTVGQTITFITSQPDAC